MQIRRFRHWASVAICLIPLSFTLGQEKDQPVAKVEKPAPQGIAIEQMQPTFLVRAEVDRESREYRHGDNISIKVVSEADAYLYVLYQQADGKTFMIFPNVAQKNNRVQAKQPVEIGVGQDLFRWKIAAPYGKEFIKVIARDKPVQALAQPMLAEKRFNPISKQLLRGISLELGAEEDSKSKPSDPSKPDTTNTSKPNNSDSSVVAKVSPQLALHQITNKDDRWAEAQVEFKTYPPDHVFEHEKVRRFGVFFGISKHKFAQYEEEVLGKSPDLLVAHRDAIELANRMKANGGLTESQVYTDQQATRANMEYAITKWLPSVSKPGDTVFVYVAGHGAQIPDDDNDEVDGLDEYLVMHDTFSFAAWAALEKRFRDGTLDPAMVSYHQYGADLARASMAKANNNTEAASKMMEQVFVRATAVTDDQFGHWLQALDGRQVIVVLDVCHSGGFSANERGIQAGQFRAPAQQRKEKFDFLDQEIVRLKDIGQSNAALFTACSAQETTMERLEKDNGVMTYSLMETLQRATGKLTLIDAHRQVSALMTSYQEQINRKRIEAGLQARPINQPLLFPPANNSFLLKP